MKLRLLTPADLPAAMALKDAAGWNQTEEDWRTFLELAPGGCACLEIDGRVVATSTAIAYGDRFGWIGMILVATDERRRGHGTRMLRAALDRLESPGVIAALDATPAGQPLYHDFGFEELYSIERWVGRAREVSESRRQPTCRPWRDGDEPRVLELDRRAFGADRTQLLLEFHRRGPPGVDLVSHDATDGFLLARPGSRFTHLGPVVATSVDRALDLLETALSGLGGELVGVDVLSDHEEVTRFLRSRGLERERSLVRMARPRPGADIDDPSPGGDPDLVYGIAGPEWG